MSLNKISAVVSQEQESQIINHIKDARNILGFLVNLTSKQRIRMSKLSRARVDFVDQSLVHVRSNPDYLPAYIELEEFVKDVELKDCLHRILAEVNSFSERLSDTLMTVESEAYRTARLFYKSVKAAAREGAEDAERISRDLAYHYRDLGPSKGESDDDSPQEEEAA